MTAKTSKKKDTLTFFYLHIAWPLLILLTCNPVFAQPSTLTHNPTDFVHTEAHKKTPLAIITQSGIQIFSVEVAQTTSSRQQGLMWRKQLQNNHGMLFVYEDSQPRRFWMKNTFIPLDIIFLDEQGVILNITQGMPQSLTQIKSKAPAHYVLEIQQGKAKELNIKPGDYIDTLSLNSLPTP